MSDLVLLSRPDCHLCHAMRAALEPVLAELGLSLSEEDVRADPEHEARWGRDIPVLLWNGVEVARQRSTSAELRARLLQLRA